MRFSLAEVIAAAERTATRARLRKLAHDQVHASQEDSIPQILRDWCVESLRAIARRITRR
jgi:hypothetical protein